jgi:hypothetical protein
MPNDRAQYEPVAWWFTRRKIGRELGKRYQPSEELSPQLLTLVRKLDALEGNQLLRECKERLRTPVEGPSAALVTSARAVSFPDVPLECLLRGRAWSANGGQ